MQNVTIGVKNIGDKNSPKIGNNVLIAAGAVVVGDITIGDNCIIGPNVVVRRDLDSGEKLL